MVLTKLLPFLAEQRQAHPIRLTVFTVHMIAGLAAVAQAVTGMLSGGSVRAQSGSRQAVVAPR